jgi:hypothetical protein
VRLGSTYFDERRLCEVETVKEHLAKVSARPLRLLVARVPWCWRLSGSYRRGVEDL